MSLALINAGELVTCAGARRAPDVEQLGIIEDGAFVAERGKVSWVGTTREYRRKTFGRPAKVVDAHGSLVTPGFVDPHTHLLFAGSREDELKRKVAGESYTEILRSGGGIARTVRETRAATSEAVVRESLGRLAQLMRNGVTTAEVKTGYGQSVREELRMVSALRMLRAEARGVEVVPTLMGLHSTPAEAGSVGEYVRQVVGEMLPRVAKMKDKPAFSDCFCEEGVFSREECSRYLKASKLLGFGCKVHADEFSESGGAYLAAEAGCVSADHLGRSEPEGIRKMAEAGVTAVLLPGTSLFSGIPYADARMILGAGCRVALGTDLSPNSWVESPQIVMSLACAGMRLSPARALLGFTREAARGLGREDLGLLAPGSAADFVVHGLPNHGFLPYRVGGRYVKKVFKGGREAWAQND
ncbi:MAG: imidazolonepropionase [Thaumarchaeota archaeon]|nr:imidazolonepropionase [Nitrososphaerota archaeon]